MADLYEVVSRAESGSTKSAEAPTPLTKVVHAKTFSASPQIFEDFFDTASTGSAFENQINARRLVRFKRHFSSRLLQLLREQEFEYGLESPIDSLIQKCLAENAAVTKQWVNQLFVQNYHDQKVTTGILRALAHFDYKDVEPEGPTIALAALAHTNAEVRECGIRAFESWVTLESLRVLENVYCPETWLNAYLKQVVADLREELDVDVAAS